MHEMGHVLGLDHTCGEAKSKRVYDHQGSIRPVCSEPAARALEQTLMYPIVSDKPGGGLLPAGPSADEKRAVCEIYPARRQ